MVGIRDEEYDAETVGQEHWLEPSHFALRGRMALDFDDVLERMAAENNYGLLKHHMDFYQYLADCYEPPLNIFMEMKMKLLADRMGITLKELYPHMIREHADTEGIDTSKALPVVSKAPVTPSEKPELPLPLRKSEGVH
ncbi:hypothetical protein K504DRAFT_450341 [Pleomassaria siparia CBS 279.74]|uniref:Uncharacterized protein n=1 Tax=Pleomassaria siparia CBS 279.74 TaxID=1314801 RepID=A0A6G1KMB0_9PLEO|nr:hypothetical protein K504DRAFT_450341 [Pleomassaria siparia CBS 279.74]